MTLYIGVVEWGSDMAAKPLVVVGESIEVIRREAVRDIIAAGPEFDEDEANELLDTPPDYNDAEAVKAWQEALFEITTDALLTIYKHRAGSHIADEVS